MGKKICLEICMRKNHVNVKKREIYLELQVFNFFLLKTNLEVTELEQFTLICISIPNIYLVTDQ